MCVSKIIASNNKKFILIKNNVSKREREREREAKVNDEG